MSIYPPKHLKNCFVDHGVLKYVLTTDKPGAAFIRSPVVSQGYKQASKHDHQMQGQQSKCFTFWSVLSVIAHAHQHARVWKYKCALAHIHWVLHPIFMRAWKKRINLRTRTLVCMRHYALCTPTCACADFFYLSVHPVGMCACTRTHTCFSTHTHIGVNEALCFVHTNMCVRGNTCVCARIHWVLHPIFMRAREKRTNPRTRTLVCMRHYWGGLGRRNVKHFTWHVTCKLTLPPMETCTLHVT